MQCDLMLAAKGVYQLSDEFHLYPTCLVSYVQNGIKSMISFFVCLSKPSYLLMVKTELVTGV